MQLTDPSIGPFGKEQGLARTGFFEVSSKELLLISTLRFIGGLIPIHYLILFAQIIFRIPEFMIETISMKWLLMPK